MPTIDEEMARIDANIAALTKLKDNFSAFQGDVAEFIRAMEQGIVVVIDHAPPPRTTAAIIAEWEVFRATRG